MLVAFILEKSIEAQLVERIYSRDTFLDDQDEDED